MNKNNELDVFIGQFLSEINGKTFCLTNIDLTNNIHRGLAKVLMNFYVFHKYTCAFKFKSKYKAKRADKNCYRMMKEVKKDNKVYYSKKIDYLFIDTDVFLKELKTQPASSFADIDKFFYGG